MTALQLAIVLLAQTAQVGGQLLLRRGMSRREGRSGFVVGGTALLALWFFAWLRLLRDLDLSYLYPFEGISLVLLVFAARVFLHEHLHGGTWIGVALITAGMILVGLN